MVSTLFNRAKTATVLGVVLFFAGYLPYFAVGPDTVSGAAKVCTLSRCCGWGSQGVPDLRIQRCQG
jgi:hypothetical protein